MQRLRTDPRFDLDRGGRGVGQHLSCHFTAVQQHQKVSIYTVSSFLLAESSALSTSSIAEQNQQKCPNAILVDRLLPACVFYAVPVIVNGCIPTSDSNQRCVTTTAG